MNSIKKVGISVVTVLALIVCVPVMAGESSAKSVDNTSSAYSGYNYGKQYNRISDSKVVVANTESAATEGYNYAREYHRLSHGGTVTMMP